MLVDQNTLYYLFSTVAQTLAAAAGFLAAFVLLRLQSWDTRVADAVQKIDGYGAKSPGLTSVYRSARDGGKDALDAAWTQAIEAKTAKDYHLSELSIPMATLAELLPRRTRLVNQF